MEITPIAYIETDFKEKFGIPRQSGRVATARGRIVFEKPYRNPDALRGIEGFSHLWLLFDFSEAHTEKWAPTVRPPRLGGNTRVGVFASRAPYRPNPIGLSVVKLLRVEETEKDGTVLHVSGVDMLDKTPIFDIKPYLPFADSVEEAMGGYADGEKDHHLSVDFPPPLLLKIPEEKRETLLSALSEDPRPSYQDDAARVYKMHFAAYDISFTVEDGTVYVKRVQTKGRQKLL